MGELGFNERLRLTGQACVSGREEKKALCEARPDGRLDKNGTRNPVRTNFWNAETKNLDPDKDLINILFWEFEGVT